MTEIFEFSIETDEVEKTKIDYVSFTDVNFKFPDYSPDGKYLIFANCPVYSRFSDIYFLELKTGRLIEFYLQHVPVEEIKWSPNSSRILIGQKDKRNLILYTPDKTLQLDLLSALKVYNPDEKYEDFFIGSFDWSPDGEEIIINVEINGFNELWVMNKDFKEIRKVMDIRELEIKNLSWGGYPQGEFTGTINITGTGFAKNYLKVFGFIVIILAVTFMSAYTLFKRHKKTKEAVKTKAAEIEKKRNLKELMLLLRDFGHSGTAAKVFDNLEFCFKNLMLRDRKDIELIENLRKMVKKYRSFIVPAVHKIIEFGEVLSETGIFISKLDKLNTRILNELKNIENQEFLEKVDEIFLHELNYLSESFNLNVKMLTEHLNTFFTADVLKITQNIVEFETANKKDKMNITLDTSRLSDNNAVIDPDDFSFIMENLISNAKKAVENSKTKKIRINLFSDVRKIYVQVSDTGCGIPEDKWQSIFLDVEGKTGGSGYGLKRSVAMLNIYGGSIKVKDSRIDEGTTMEVVLRINRA